MQWLLYLVYVMFLVLAHFSPQWGPEDMCLYVFNKM